MTNPAVPNAAATNPAPASTAGSLAPAPGGNTPPAAPPANQGGVTTETINPGAWQAGFNDDLKGYVQNKGFKDPAAVAEAYRNLEKLQGVPQERLMKMPENFYDDKGQLTPEGRGIYERLGAPKEAKDYEIAMPKEGGDQARLDNFLKTAHELGLTKAQAQKLAAADDAYAQDFVKRQQEAGVQAFNDGEKALRKDWGAAYDDNLQNAREGVRRLGWDGQKIDALSRTLGHAETMKMLAQMGRSVGEAGFVNGGGSNANRPMEPAAAKAKIAELQKDSTFASKLMAGDGDAKSLWNRLHEQAYQGTVNI